MKLTTYQKAADRYIPLKTNVLFVAESPPDALDRYFYFENVKNQDSLWIGLMKALYEGEFGETSKERLCKEKWLTKFKDDGYRLIDALKEPVVKSTGPPKRKKLISNVVDHVVEEIREISPNQIVLIKATVFDVLYGRLHAAGLPVVNERLSFPGLGHQKKFAERFENLVSDRRLTLSK